MVGFRTFALGALAVAALTSAAAAADLLPPPPEPPPPIVAPDLGGWYLRGDVGVGFNDHPPFAASPDGTAGIVGATSAMFNPTLGQSAIFDAGVGYQFNQWFRADITAELRGGAALQGLDVCANCTGAGNQLSDFYRGNLSSYLGMVNGYANLGTWWGLTPYVGAGLGFAYNRLTGATDNGFNYVNAGGTQTGYPVGGYFNDGGHMDFAWSLMAGLEFDVTRNLKLDLGYRYLNYGGFNSGGSHCLTGTAVPAFNCQSYSLVGHNLSSNDFTIGLLYYLDTTPPPQAPLVRKY